MIYNWMRMLFAVLLGNVIYFAAQPVLPETARHHLYSIDPGLVLDFAICVGIYLLVRQQKKEPS
jgi:hypothetical protein